MADSKRPKAPAPDAHRDEPFRPIMGQPTEPNTLARIDGPFDGEPLDLSELDGLLDDPEPAEFPASDTGFASLAEPAPLPPEIGRASCRERVLQVV